MNKHKLVQSASFRAIRKIFWNNALTRKLTTHLDDKIYFKVSYWWHTLKILDYNNPGLYTEKIQWMNMNCKNPLYSQCADKYLVREYVIDKLGEEGHQLLPALYGVFDSVENMDINKLPNSFALKANHGSGWNVIVKNKRDINWKSAKNKLSKWLNSNYYEHGRQFQYKNIKPLIICEEFLENPDGTEILDYKFMCFNGEPTMIWIDFDRYSKHIRNYYSIEGEPLYYESDVPTDYSRPFIKPKNYDKMVDIAKILSKDFPHVRVDLYNIEGRILLGEMTFTSWGGYVSFGTTELDELWGKSFDLKTVKFENNYQ